MSYNVRRILQWSKILIILYCAIGIALYYLQDKILIHNTALPFDYKFKFKGTFKELFIPINKKDTIHLVQFFPDNFIDTNHTKGLVLFFHDANENVKDCSERVELYTKNGYEIWIPDYPGFGKSVGDLNEKQLYEEAYQIKRLAVNRFQEDKIIIQGAEFGAAIAANLAASSKVKHLILESPYISVPDMLSDYLPIYPWSSMCHYKMPTCKFLEDVQCPVTVFSMDRDDSRMKQFLKKNDQIIMVKENSELELSKSKVFEEKMYAVLKDTTTLLN